MAPSKLGAFFARLRRTRVVDQELLETGKLKRCLNIWDLIALGLGSTLGVGVYVVIGSVALNLAGPSIVLSFAVAALASLFAGLCYSEFGSRVPKAGSAYIYAYVTLGEFVAFIIGWNIILESLFGTASVARGLSLYVNNLANDSMATWFRSVAPIDVSFLSTYFDFFSFLIVIILGVCMSFGVRKSLMANNVFTVINMAVIAFIIIAGSFKADPDNWRIPVESVPAGRGEGGFFPYGAAGVLRGAAVCFYGFVGFDAISYSGEEVRDPHRSIPVAILSVLGLVFLAYSGVSIVVTMMVPYYLHDTVASVATAFYTLGWNWGRWIVACGAVFGISASLFGALFPLPRLLYAMSSHGLLPRVLSKLSAKRRAPARATLLSCAVVAVLAAVMELEQLVMMMCVGNLLSYSIVAICVIVLRYESDLTPSQVPSYWRQVFGRGDSLPTIASWRVVYLSLVLFVIACGAVGWTVTIRPRIAAVLHVVVVLPLVAMALQPRRQDLSHSFQTPLVPLVPCLSIYFNIQLMSLISGQTWIRALVWLLIGIPVYIICVCCQKEKSSERRTVLDAKTFPHVDENGKNVKIIVESPTPTDTVISNSKSVNSNTKSLNIVNVPEENSDNNNVKLIMEDIIVQQATIDYNEEKEAKIIDLLDQVLQAEEDTYGEVVSLNEQTSEEVGESTSSEILPSRKSVSEISDAGSDASFSGSHILSKYDVIAQVHREDMPKVNEEDLEETDVKKDEFKNNDVDQNLPPTPEHENVTFFNESDDSSRTDEESGYSDTTDKNNELLEYKEEAPRIPSPPPFDENLFSMIPFKKSFTLAVRPKPSMTDKLDESKPRESVQSNGSYDDTTIVFGSARQMNFMSKLNNIFQNKITTGPEEEQIRRSISTGNIFDKSELEISRERPAMFFDLKKELLARTAMNMVPAENKESEGESLEKEDTTETIDDHSLSREDLKSKLENMFATGGPKPFKSKAMKSNPPTPEEAYQTDNSSAESIPKLPKIEKNDTLKRQKDKFGDVLNSFRLSMLKDDTV